MESSRFAVCGCAAMALAGCLLAVLSLSAADYAFTEKPSSPAEAHSGPGIESFAMTDGGLEIVLSTNLDFALSRPSGATGFPSLSYSILDAGGIVLSKGSGRSVPLSRFKNAKSVRFVSSDPSFDWSDIQAVETTRAGGSAKSAYAAVLPSKKKSNAQTCAVEAGDSAQGLLRAAGTPLQSGEIRDGSEGYGILSYSSSEDAPYHSNEFERVIISQSYTPETTGIYEVSSASDDYATITVGPLSASSSLFSPASCTGILFRAQTYTVHADWSNVGGPAFVDVSLSFVRPLDLELPHLEVSPSVVTLVLKNDAVVASGAVTAEIVGGSPGLNSWIETTLPDGLSMNGNSVSVSNVSKLLNSKDGSLQAKYSLYVEGAGVVDTATVVFVLQSETDDEESAESGCDCNEGTEVSSQSVSFSQKFGRTPQIPGMPEGRLRIHESMPTDRLVSPRALFYDHPVERRIVGRSDAGLDATIRSPSGFMTEYRDGAPANGSKGLGRRIARDAQGCLVEELSDGLCLTYDPSGRVKSIRPRGASVAIPATNIGIRIDRRGGAITNVWSAADGNMSVKTLSSKKFRVEWTSPSGEPVKSFTFEKPTQNKFTLSEYRDEDFNFEYEWDYSETAKDWTLTKAPGTGDEIKEEKSIVYDSEAKAWTAVRGWRKGNGDLTGIETSVVDVNGAAPKTTARSIGGRLVYSSVRGEDGLTAADTNETGLATLYSYDSQGRLSLQTRTVKGGLAESVSYQYGPSVNGGILERRPCRAIRSLDGVVASDTEWIFETNRTTRIRRCGEAARTSFDEFDDYGRVTLSVDEAGRATRTVYAPAEPSLGGWEETSDEGVCSSGAFVLVEGKSTRRVSQYDEAGNMTNIVKYAYAGGVWRFVSSEARTCNATHKTTSTVRSDGKTSAASWICTGPVWRTGEDGISVTNIYDKTKALVSSTRYGPFGAVCKSYVRDAAGRVVEETKTAPGVEAQTETRSYDESGRIVSSTDAQGLTTTYAYPADGRVETVTFPGGGTRITSVNPDGSLASVAGTATVPEYHTYGVTAQGLEWEKIAFLSPDGARWKKIFKNAFGDIVREERPGVDGSTLSKEYSYGSKGRVVSIVATGEPAESRIYDCWGDLASTTRTAGGQSRTESHARAYVFEDGEVWSVETNVLYCSDGAIAPLTTVEKEQVSGLSLSNETNRISIDPRGNVSKSRSSFDPAASARRIVDAAPWAANDAERVFVDGMQTLSVSHSAVTNAISYDAYSRAVSQTDGRGNVSTRTYGPDGLLLAETDAAGNATRYAYDDAGMVRATTNALGVATIYEYDVRGNRTYEGGGTHPVSYAYDGYNVMTNMTTYRAEGSQSGDTTSWICDEATGLLLAKTYADGNGPAYTYTANGNLATRTWARGIVTTYAYDGWNNLTNIVYSDGTPSISYSYDALGRLTNAVDAAGATATEYDAFGDKTSESTSGLYVKNLVHHRDAFGRDLGYTIDNSRKSIIEYEQDTGRMKRVKYAGAWFTYSYLEGTDLKSRLQYGGSGSAYYTYEQNRDLLTQVRNYINGGVVSQYDYVNDALGRRTATIRSGSMMSETRTDCYGYNDRNELISATKNTEGTEYRYSYDDIGNRLASLDLGTNRTYAANALNQYTTISNLVPSVSFVSGFQPQFDLDGNQTLIETPTGVWSVTYNGENRPVLWECGPTNIVMKFDRMGRRVGYVETVFADSDGVQLAKTIITNAHRRFVYDGYLCIQRLDGAANNAIDLAFGWDPSEPAATRPLVMQKYGRYDFFYTHDGNKNVSELVSFQRSRGIPAHYEYAPFGGVTAVSADTTIADLDIAAINPYRFSSEYADDAPGLVYYNYRHYNPLAGRWTSRDPSDDELAYCYVENAAIGETDFIGLLDIDASCKKIKEPLLAELEIARSKMLKWFGAFYEHNVDTSLKKDMKKKHNQERKRRISAVEKLIKGANFDLKRDFKKMDTRGVVDKIIKDSDLQGNGKLKIDCCPIECKMPFNKNAAASVDSRNKDRIILCDSAMNGASEFGGYGCLLVHEMLHRAGLTIDERDSREVVLQKERAIVEIQKTIIGTECKGYGL